MKLFFKGMERKCLNCQKDDCPKKNYDRLINVIVDFNEDVVIIENCSSNNNHGISDLVFKYDISVHPSLFNGRSNILFLNTRSVLKHRKKFYRHDYNNGFVYFVRASGHSIHIDDIIYEFEKWFRNIVGVRYETQPLFTKKIRNDLITPFQYIPTNSKKLDEYSQFIYAYYDQRFRLLDALINNKDNEGNKFSYIPDFFVPSLGLEIEVKDIE